MTTPRGNNTTTDPTVSENVTNLLGWPTDTVSIDWDLNQRNDDAVHTILLLIPGNPGCSAWYTPLLMSLVSTLGRGYCARAVSYAGHSAFHPDHTTVMINEQERDAKMSWTVNGQILHKEAFIDKVWNGKKKLIFISHSIGSHMVERLCVQRPDILRSTTCVIHLMPFIQMNPTNKFDKRKLDFGGARPNVLIFVAKCTMHTLRILPVSWVDRLLVLQNVYECPKGRKLASHLLQQPAFAHNFFELGTEEIRDVPEELDVAALKLISAHCPMYFVYCNNDQWSPKEQAAEIQNQVTDNVHPISSLYLPNHSHDFVSKDGMVHPIVEWCLHAIQQSSVGPTGTPRSRL